MTENQAALKFALQILRKSDTLEGELRSRLEQKGFSQEVVATVIEALKARRFLDDQRVVEELVDRRTANERRGKHRIIAELARKGVAEPLLNEVEARLAPSEEEARAEAWFAKRAFRNAGQAGRFLLAQGFDEEVVRQVVERRFEGAEAGASAEHDPGNGQDRW